MGFLDEPEDKKTAEEAGEEKIKVGELEFAPEELQNIVGKYRDLDAKAKDMGGLDKVISYAGDQARQLGEVRAELQAERERKAKVDKPTNNGEPSPEDVIRAAEEQGFITKQNLNTYLAQYRSAEKLLDEVQQMEAKGNPYEAKELPPFVASDMLDYMTQTGIKNPRKAYLDRYETEIDAWKQKTLNSGRPSGMKTEERAPGNKQPTPIKITRDNLAQSISSALNGEI
jgi:hypothetical protein